MTTTAEHSTDVAPSVRRWDVPAPVVPRGVLVVVPGRGEHPGLYERFGRRISADGYLVRVVADPTTHPGEAGRQVSDVLAGETASGPQVLVGSDSGALFATVLLAEGTVTVDGLILAGLLTSGSTSPELGWDAELRARTACPAHQGVLAGDAGFRRGALSGEPPADWFSRADLGRVLIPVLGLHGSEDRLSPMDAARAAYARAAHAELVSIAGGRHDAFNDQTHRTAAATVVLFLERLRLNADVTPIARYESLINH